MATRQQIIAARDMVKVFRSRTTPGKFVHIQRVEVAADLLLRVASPIRINQAEGSLCGPASVVFLTAERDPETYARFVIELYENGESRLGKLVVKPGADCLRYNPKSGSSSYYVPPADWIALASFRDSQNRVFDYQSHKNRFAGITTPAQLTTWLQCLGYKATLNDANVAFHKPLANAKRANDLFLKGYKICLLINANVLDAMAASMSTAPRLRFAPGGVRPKVLPDHWVPLLSPLSIASSGIQFEIFTWGKRRMVPGTGSALSQDDFVRHFFGFVACMM
ncbi:MAG TPA: hypothetical protein PKD86_18650 [Gemmatales bacterium]|nr:hypothetical protein [Gemmatales bacterium]